MRIPTFIGICFVSAALLITAGCDRECEIENRTLEDGVVGQHYGQVLTSTCEGNQEWYLFSGDIPPGVALFGDGVLEGVPELPGIYEFTIGVDQVGNNLETTNSAAKSFTVTIR